MGSKAFKQRLDEFLRGRECAGCTQEEIESLSRRHDVTFPADYRQFLLQAGKGADGLWRGSHYEFDSLDGMQLAAVKLLAADGLTLPPKSFVFYMHQGYQFFYMCDDGVFYFLEGNAMVERSHSTFEEFFDSFF